MAVGSVRELFGRLRHYRNRQQKRGGNPLLVIVGHSFGGMIVFSALAQSLIQAASAPVGVVTPEFADLVLLVNPAIEAARYIPIYDLVTSAAFKARTTKQLPVFICAQAENDLPVGMVFPLGNAGHAIKPTSLSCSTRPAPCRRTHSGWSERRRKSSTDTAASGRRRSFSSSRASSSSTCRPRRRDRAVEPCHSSRTVTASDAPLASVTDTRAKPAPSGFQADWRLISASPTGAPLTNQVNGGAPPSAFKASG